MNLSLVTVKYEICLMSQHFKQVLFTKSEAIQRLLKMDKNKYNKRGIIFYVHRSTTHHINKM